MRKLLFTLFILTSHISFAQHLLGKVVSINIENQSLASALNTISETGNFQFSYKSDIVLQDKKVSLKEDNKSVKYILDKLLEGSYHYTEKGKYIIIHAGGERFFTISGYIQNGNTGERISNVTVYEDQILASTLSNEQGYFRLPIKNKRKLKKVSIIVRKESYSENTVALNAGYDQELVLPIVPSKEIYLNDVVVKNEPIEEQSWATKFLISSKQKLQNLNIGTFFANRPLQTSILPGIGSRGLIGSQVVNKFSLNMLGGYTAGVNGFELGTIFNINKGDVSGAQISGVFNNVNGNLNGYQVACVYNYVAQNTYGVQISGIGNIVKKNVIGIQIAGVSNLDLDTVKGVEIAGISNHNEKETIGVQFAGIININKKTTRGLQIAGITNHCDTDAKGMQFAGISNHALRKINGVQMAGIYNYAHKMKGFQFGLINIADTMDGLGIGLVNIYKNGKHKLVISSNELQQVNIAFLSGTNDFYSIIGIGGNIDLRNQLYTTSFGIGSDIRLSKKYSLNPECYAQVVYLGSWGYVPLVAKAQLSLAYRASRKIELFAGASYSITENRVGNPAKDFRPWLQLPNIQYRTIEKNNIASWMGWQAGLRIF